MKRICFLDVEVSPEKVYVYERYEASVVGKVERSILFSIAWKWEGDKEVYCKSLIDFKIKEPHDDKPLTEFAWKLLDEADVVIAHNGTSFDVKKLNAFFIYHKLKPPSPFKQVDTLKVARKYFKFFGNSLNDISEFFGIGKKIETEHGLWYKCLNANKRAYSQMKRYNKHDVRLLVDIYKRMLPYIEIHPPINPTMKKHGTCNNCGKDKLQSRGITIVSSGVRSHRYHCQGCGHWSRVKV